MKTSERHHLKDNELALALGRASDYAAQNQRRLLMGVGAVTVLAIALIGFLVWRNNVESRSRGMLAEGMVALDARVVPPPPPGTALEGGPLPAPQPGTYPSEHAKLEAALPKFLAAADAYPSTDGGRTARYQAATTLVALGRFDEAVKQYDQLTSGSGLISQTARLGKAEAQSRAGQYDGAISTFKELSERTDTNLPKEAILLELARAYNLAGKTEDARKTLNQIVEQHAASPFAAEAKTELEKIKG
jgi:tetratricopeptide (TPR) repeat protein